MRLWARISCTTFRSCSLRQQQGARVPQVVETLPRQAGGTQHAGEVSVDVARLQQCGEGGRKDEPGMDAR